MRRGLFGTVGLVIVAAIGVILYLSLFVVEQTQQALVLRFGQVVRQAEDPGLYYKLPLIDDVVYFDKRLLDLDSPSLEVIASDQKRLIVDAWSRYRIINPLTFFQTVGTVAVANDRLAIFLNSAVRQVLGDATFIQLVRDERAELMARITQRLDREARGIGIEVFDVKIRRADLPEANSQAIYQRMQTERQREATELRALGEQQARRIRAEADRTATVIVAEAQQESERVRGEGEGKRNLIFAEAFGVDADFFSFYRSMQAYQIGLGGSSDTRLVISPDSQFFKFFNDSLGGAEVALPAAGLEESESDDTAAATDAMEDVESEAAAEVEESAMEDTAVVDIETPAAADGAAEVIAGEDPAPADSESITIE
ncbi:MAG: protease modulator HflC [Hyphomicrobiales bacterium]|nr:protease modulator HflC [Hyphomicrobiales bacterium]